jgi:oligoendopeptidase F
LDIEKIGADKLLSQETKITRLINRLASFNKNKESSDIAILDLYQGYESLFNQFNQELKECQDKNKEYKEIYNNVQQI